MSTEIKDVTNEDDIHELETYDDGRLVEIRVKDYGTHATANVARADFLAAVEVELGVLVIDRADLPKVEDTGYTERDKTLVPIGWGEDYRKGFGRDELAHRARRYAMHYLAVAEWLEHPPVDEAQANALTEILADNETIITGADNWYDVATRLLATGRIEVKP